MDLSSIEIGFECGEGNDAVCKEIVRNVHTLLLTPLGTCPLYRDFGLDITYLDFPSNIAKGLFTAAAIEAVECWEPRARVSRVDFQADGADGKIRAKVVLAIG